MPTATGGQVTRIPHDASTDAHDSGRHEGPAPDLDAAAGSRDSGTTDSGDTGPRRVVLFDGSSLDAWASSSGGPAAWTVSMGYMEIVPGTGDIHTKQAFTDFLLHVEFWVPKSPATATEQQRGNSGIYLQGRYELQVLDSYGYPISGANDCGAFYGIKDPSSNASTPPETWQTYDVTFHAAQFAGAMKTADARTSVMWNGTEVQHDVDLPRATQLGDAESNAAGGIRLQDHGYLVRYRNIWLEELP